ncbi:probable polygalacturonase At3g15720 [Carica papaya]|uniref:probable polygalacturonase At3g15720 n=1 Tax=Carica papaya TaxID=3649 RepID=UPI000B8CB69A|nr:probable polygalacturonase At3g15720 [Carica papaya]
MSFDKNLKRFVRLFQNPQAFTKAWGALCEAAGSPQLQIPAEYTFLLQSLRFCGPCASNSLNILVLGNIVAPNSIEEWSQCGVEYWLCFYRVDGLTISGTGKIDGHGSAWWSYVNETCPRPRALYLHECNNLELRGLTHLNSQRNHIAIHQCNHVSISDLHIIAPKTSPNTDGIDLSSSSQINISHSFIGTGDDCIAIKGGTSHIYITDVTCGPGHGISVGSLGDDQDNRVKEVYVQHCTLNSTQNGVRIKTIQGGSGYARVISFKDVTFIDSKNPIIIDQHYVDKHISQISEVNVSGVTYSGLQGTSIDEIAINLNCSSIGCEGIVMEEVNITSSVPGKKTYSYCKNAKGKSISTVPDVPCLSG